MPRYLKLSISAVLCVFTLGLMGCNDYTPNPEDDIALFQPFIDANVNKKSDDPYISSTVKPGDKLYDILVNIQHGRHDVAIKQLKPLVDKGDADAQFWYAKMIYRSSVKSIAPAFRLYQEAAKAGNAYAQFELSPDSEGCLVYFGEKECTQENLTKAIEMFKQKAKQGDLGAQYFLLKKLTTDGELVPIITENQLANGNYYQLNFSKESRQHYLKEVIRFAENHYYQPLMDYVDTILTKKTPSSQLVAKSKSLESLALDLLKIAANNNYIPAINEIIEFKNSNMKKNDPLFLQGQKLASRKTLSWQMLIYASDMYSQNYTPEERYHVGSLAGLITGDYELLNRKFDEGSLTQQEINDLNEDIEKMFRSMTPMIYIDGFTSRDKWVD